MKTSPLRRWQQLGRSPKIDLSLVEEPDDEPNGDAASEGHMSCCNSPSESSSSSDSGCRAPLFDSPHHRATTTGTCTSEPASSPTSEAGLLRIMRRVRRPAEEY